MKKLIMILLGLLFYTPPMFAMESESFSSTSLQNGIQFKQHKDTTNKQVLLEKVSNEGFTRVIIDYDMDKVYKDYMARGQSLSPKIAIAETHSRFIKDISNRRLNFSGINKVVGRPRIALSIDEDALKTLYEFPYIQNISIERIFKPHLLESTSIINADSTWDLGFSGEGEIIVIIDTGVDPNHEMLDGKVIDGACFSTHDSINGISELCTDQTYGVSSGENCTGINGCDHGTHVAGIAAGNGPSLKGVAYGADIISIQVFSEIDVDSLCEESTPCLGIMEGDLDEALFSVSSYFRDQQNYNISAVNMSLGGGQFSSECDTDPLVQSINTLTGAGISVVAASGNENFTNAMGSPACIPNVISVGATNSQDKHWSESDTVGSNSAPFLDLVAPGVDINSSIPGDDYSAFSGTSMAAPHVSGTIAVMRGATPSLSVPQIRSILRNSAYWESSMNPDYPHYPPSNKYGYGRLDTYESLFGALYLNPNVILPDDNFVFADETFEGKDIYVQDDFTLTLQGVVTLDKNQTLNDRPSSLNVVGTLAGPSSASLNLIDESTLNIISGGINNFGGDINIIIQDELTFDEDTTIENGFNLVIESGGTLNLVDGVTLSTELGVEFTMEPNTQITSIASASMQNMQIAGSSNSVVSSTSIISEQKIKPTYEDKSFPSEFGLGSNYPNPFNPTTVISYQIPVNSQVTLKVFDILGREVATLVDGQVSAGLHEVRFDASSLSSGIYIYRIRANDFVETRQMTLIK